MAKLSDLTTWLTNALRGDAPRARSIIQLTRKAGIFPTGGRGTNAPDMGAEEGAKAVLLALMGDPPTKSVERLDELSRLPFIRAVVSHGRQDDGINYDRAHFQNSDLPKQFKRLPDNPLEALTYLITSDEFSYHLDHCGLEDSDHYTLFTLHVFDLDRPEGGGTAEHDFFNVMFFFRAHRESDPESFGISVDRKLGGSAIAALQSLLTGREQE